MFGYGGQATPNATKESEDSSKNSSLLCVQFDTHKPALKALLEKMKIMRSNNAY